MATFSFSGFDKEIEKMAKLARGSDKPFEAAVKAGAEYMAKRLGEAAPVDTGKLSKSVKAGKVDYNAGDGYHCRIEPVGKNHGEPLAKIGNIIEYGHGDVPPNPWWAPTIAREEEAAFRAAAEAFYKELEGTQP